MKKKINIKALTLFLGAISLAATSLLAQIGQAKEVSTSNTSRTIYIDWRAADRFVEGRGVNYADGSSAHPYTTVTRGHSEANPGDTLIVREGIYPEDVTLSKAVTVKEEGGTVRIGKSLLSVKLPRSLIMEPADTTDKDWDYDCLVDSMENALADAFRPYCIFDSDESARQQYEPVTLFQVRPVEIQTSNVRIMIKWVFLFELDGGYGPSSLFCFNSHAGDNDNAYYELTSNDAGLTWVLVRAGLGSGGIEWPTNSRLSVYDPTHPIIYMSASKHHEYFTRDWDNQSSKYSDAACNDDVNGLGAGVLVDLRSLAVTIFYNGCWNNVGEPEYHPSLPFINHLTPYYRRYYAWEGESFYEVPPVSSKWLTHAFTCNR